MMMMMMMMIKSLYALGVGTSHDIITSQQPRGDDF